MHYYYFVHFRYFYYCYHCFYFLFVVLLLFSLDVVLFIAWVYNLIVLLLLLLVVFLLSISSLYFYVSFQCILWFAYLFLFNLLYLVFLIFVERLMSRDIFVVMSGLLLSFEIILHVQSMFLICVLGDYRSHILLWYVFYFLCYHISDNLVDRLLLGF